MFIYVAGIPGSGKTTVIKSVVDQFKNEGKKIESVRGLPILCKLAGDISPDEFRKLPDNIREKYRPEMFRIIYEEDKKDPNTLRVLDGHFIYFEVSGEGYSVREIYEEDFYQIKAIFVINSTPENVLQRRMLDKNERADRSLDLVRVKKQLKLETEEAIRQAVELNIPITFINNDGELKEAVSELVRRIKELSWIDEITEYKKY